MLQLNARFFVGVASELRQIQVIITNVGNKEQAIGSDDRRLIREHLDRMIDAIKAIGARSAYRSAERLKALLEDDANHPYYSAMALSLGDIESRFADHLDDVVLFVVPDQRASLFMDAADLIGGEDGEDITFHFSSATFEIEEAAKCLALGRPTASAFHSMRTLEIGIAALAKHLDIPDPVKAAERNWAVMLEKITEAIDKRFPKSRRLPRSEGADLEGLYATLDAVKNPWRNATMHVDTVYTDADAQHILQCTLVFMKNLMQRCDEDGLPRAGDIEQTFNLNDLDAPDQSA